MSIEISQLLSEEQWILNTIKNIKVQINALEIERLHLENLITKHTKLPQEVYLASIKDDDDNDVEPSTSLNTVEMGSDQDDQMIFEWPELNLRVDCNAPGNSTNHMEEEEEDEDENEGDNSNFDDLHKFML